MKTISDQHDEIHQLKEKLWSQHVTLDNQHTLIHGLQLQISNMKSEQELNLQNMKSEQKLKIKKVKWELQVLLVSKELLDLKEKKVKQEYFFLENMNGQERCQKEQCLLLRNIVRP